MLALDAVPAQSYDSVVAIGLAMFFACPDAETLIAQIRDAVRPGGVAAVNEPIEGTTFLDMLTRGDYCLFGEVAPEAAFSGSTVEYLKIDEFPAPR